MLCDRVQAQTDPQVQKKGKALQNTNAHSEIKFKNYHKKSSRQVTLTQEKV